LLILRQNPLIEQINAELGPGVTPGEGILRVKVAEQRPYTLALAFNNYRSPSIGSKQGEVVATHSNLTGWGDRLWARYGLTEGVDEVAASYTIPLNAYDTTLGLRFDRSSALVIEEPFSDLDITSEIETYGVALSQPFYLSPYQTFSIGLALERRHSEAFLLGIIPFPSPGTQDGESDVTVLRFSQEWLSRSVTQVVAARSIFSVGIDALGATINPSPPDGKFFTWSGQFQWARRLPYWDSEVLFRSDVQLASEALLSLEKLPVGGANSVRGYRENQLVRDNGWLSSLEFRVPVFRLPLPWLSERPEEGRVLLAPFADFGLSWNTGSSTPEPEIIYSVGLGVRWDPTRRIHSQLYWGKALKDVDNTGTDLQDDGIHFLVSFQVL
jgi:hemolysin activation/secretion protein